MENFEDRFEVLHLDSDDEVDFDFLPLLSDEYEEEDDHFRAAEEGIVNPFFVCVIQILCFQAGFGRVLDFGLEKYCANST